MKKSVTIILCIAALLATKANDSNVLESWQVLMPSQNRYDFQVDPKFCFIWDGVSEPKIGVKQAVEAAQKGYGKVYDYINPPRRELRSVRLVRSALGASYYQVLLGEIVSDGAFGASTGADVDIPVAVGANAQVLMPVRVISAWKKEDLPKQPYWSK